MPVHTEKKKLKRSASFFLPTKASTERQAEDKKKFLKKSKKTIFVDKPVNSKFAKPRIPKQKPKPRRKRKVVKKTGIPKRDPKPTKSPNEIQLELISKTFELQKELLQKLLKK